MATDHRLLQCDISIQNLPPSCTAPSQSRHNPIWAFWRPRRCQTYQNTTCTLSSGFLRDSSIQWLPSSVSPRAKQTYRKAYSSQRGTHKAEFNKNPPVVSSETRGEIISVVPSEAQNCYSSNYHQVVPSNVDDTARSRSHFSSTVWTQRQSRLLLRFISPTRLLLMLSLNILSLYHPLFSLFFNVDFIISS